MRGKGVRRLEAVVSVKVKWLVSHTLLERARVDRGFQRRSRKRGGKSTASKAPAKTRTVSKAKAKKKAKPAPA